MKKQLYIIDGYNMIGAWPELVALKKQDDLESARDLLIQRCSNFQKFENIEVWIVFDAQFVPGITQSFDEAEVKVIFTAEGETADSYIERTVSEMNMHQRKNQETEIVQTMGVLSAVKRDNALLVNT